MARHGKSVERLPRSCLARGAYAYTVIAMGNLRRGALAVLFCLVLPPGVSRAGTPAVDVVSALHESLLSVMKNAEALGFDGRRAQLAPVIAESFDMRLIARGSTGRHWRTLDTEQRKNLTEEMTRLTVATYAARFDDYAGENFRVVSEEPATRSTVLVATKLVKGDGEEIRLNYLLYRAKAGWRIVDVYLKGVYSELALKRAEYNAVIKRKGFDGLLAAIESKIADFAAEAPD